MNRCDFLKRLTLPSAAGAAALVARRLDPDGEPVPETAPLIVVNAPHTTLQNLNLTSGVSRRTAIEVTPKAETVHFAAGVIRTDGGVRMSS